MTVDQIQCGVICSRGEECGGLHYDRASHVCTLAKVWLNTDWRDIMTIYSLQIDCLPGGSSLSADRVEIFILSHIKPCPGKLLNLYFVF